MAKPAMYHGCDSNTNPYNDPCIDAFYIGQLGMGVIAGDSTVVNESYCITFTNSGGTGMTNEYAQAVINLNQTIHTYGYWFLLGPKFAKETTSIRSTPCGTGHTTTAATTVSEAFAWGEAQANAAASAWSSYSAILRRTIFADIEQADAAGWYSQTDGTVDGTEWYALNRAVIQGFVERMNHIPFHAGGHFVGGIYINPNDYQVITNNMDFAGLTSHLWTADYTGGDVCYPDFNPPSLGGVMTQIWQYYSNGTSLDFDAANALPG